MYNVFKGDKDGFVSAVKSALENPIPRCVDEMNYIFIAPRLLTRIGISCRAFRTILPHMKQEAVTERLSAILEYDWKKEAEEIMEERKNTGVGEVSTSGLPILSYCVRCSRTIISFVSVDLPDLGVQIKERTQNFLACIVSSTLRTPDAHTSRFRSGIVFWNPAMTNERRSCPSCRM